MTIRFTCAGCGSLLKIKEELAGTDGKCPKCKTEFVVPEPPTEADSEFEVETSGEPTETRSSTKKATEKVAEKPWVEADSEFEVETSGEPTEARSSTERTADKTTEKVAEKTRQKSDAKTASKPAAKPKKAAATGDDFDPADFLMGGDDAPRRSTPVPAITNVDPDEDDRRMGATSRPKKLSKSPTPGGGATEGVSASAHAKEMMMKAMDESRTHAGDAPAEEAREGFDWAGYFREYGFKGGGAILLILLLAYGLSFVFDRMLGSSLKLPKLGYVSGEVKLDGNPLPGATVYFAPKDAQIPGANKEKERPRTSFGITDDKGHYTMIYIDRIEGVAAGKCRVWLDLIGPKGQVIPPNFTEAVMTERLVKPGKNEDINFEMKSTP